MDYTNWLHITNLPITSKQLARVIWNCPLRMMPFKIKNFWRLTKEFVNSQPILTALSFTIKLISIDWKHIYQRKLTSHLLHVDNATCALRIERSASLLFSVFCNLNFYWSLSNLKRRHTKAMKYYLTTLADVTSIYVYPSFFLAHNAR